MRLSYFVATTAFLISHYIKNFKVNGEIVHGSKPQHIQITPGQSLKSCTPSLSVAFVIDTTESMRDSIVYIKANVLGVIDQITKKFPQTQFSISTFTDKPISPLGFDLPIWRDYCLKISTTFSDTMDKHTQAVNVVTPGGGKDFYESQLDSLFRAAVAPQLKWRTEPILSDGSPHAKVIIMVTDAYFHTAGDAKKAANGTQGLEDTVESHNLLSTSLTDDPDSFCKTMDYPTPTQLGQVIREKNYLPIFLVSPAHYLCITGTCPYPELKRTAKQLNNTIYADPYAGMELMFKTLLQDMDVTGFVQPISDDTIAFTNTFFSSLNTLLDFSSFCNTTNPPDITVTDPDITVTKPEIPPKDPNCINTIDCVHNGCCADVHINVNVTVS